MRLLIDGVISEADGKETLTQLRAVREKLEQEIAGMTERPKIVGLHPAAVNDYLAAVDRLAETLKTQDGSEPEALHPVRDLIDQVTIVPGPERSFTIEVEGKLNHLIGGNQYPAMKLGD